MDRTYNRFEIVKPLKLPKGADKGNLNEGLFVVKAKSSGKHYVEKRLKPEDVDNGHAKRESNALAQLQGHPNICHWKGSDIDAGALHGSIYVAYYELGALDRLIDRFKCRNRPISENFVWRVLLSLADALLYCMYGAKRCDNGEVRGVKKDWNYVIHRDIKPGNVFLGHSDNSTYPLIVLGDFGCSISLKDITKRLAHPKKASRYTAVFAPPEFPASTSRRSDTYQIALVAACLCNLWYAPPRDIKGRPDYDGAWKIEPAGPNYSEGLNRILRRCLSTDPGHRPSTLHLPTHIFKAWLQYQKKSPKRPLPRWALRDD